MRCTFSVLFAAMVCLAPVTWALAAQGIKADLTSVADVKALTAESLADHVRARISGQITYVDGLRSLILQDGTGGILVQNPNLEVELKRGQRIEVIGDITRTRPAPTMTGASVRILDRSLRTPQAIAANDDTLTGLQSQYFFVELQGIVRSASEDEESHARADLTLFAYGREISVSIRDIGADDYHRLEDATIRVRGVLCVRVNASGDPVIFKLYAQSITDISVLAPAPSLDTVQLTTVAKIRSDWLANKKTDQNRDDEAKHRIRLRGTITLGGEGLNFADSSGTISISPSSHSELPPNAGIQDLLAFVSNEDGVPVLIDGQPLRRKPSATGEPTGAVTTVIAVRQLSDEEVRRNRRVHLRGVVTYADPSVRDTFIQDATGGIFLFAPTGGKLDLKLGQYVAIDGLVSVGGFAPVITEPTARVLGNLPLPKPLALDMEQLFTGNADSQLVEAQGKVRSARREAGHLRLEIVWGSHRYLASVAGITEVPPWLLNASVRLVGVCGAVSNFKHQILGIELNIPDISLIRPYGKPDSEHLSLERIDHLLQYSPERDGDERAHIQGKVTYTSPQGPTYLSDFSGSVLVKTHTPVNLRVGDWVEALGTPHSGTFAPFLEDAKLTRIATLKPPKARVATYDAILEKGSEADFVQIDGYLVSDSSGNGENTIVLQAGDSIFEANLMQGRLPALTKGSLLRMEGLTSLTVDASAQIVAPIGFSILLRSPDDIQILQTAPWWTTARLRNAGFGGFAFVLASFSWIVVLRRQVGRKTQQLSLANEELLQLSSRDGLTGVANRRKFDETLDSEYSRARESSSKLSLIMVDIDHFKALNDDYGHQRGDECLVAVVRALESVLLRKTDIVARYGGEEFAAVLPDTDLDAALAVAERMRAAVSKLGIPNARSPFNQTLSVSIGLAVLKPDLTSPSALLKIADQALYRSKSNGRNRITTMEELGREQRLALQA